MNNGPDKAVAAIITDVVTGKLDLRQAAANLAQKADEESAHGMDGAGAGDHNDE